jgi:hypothetical protein
MTAAIFAFRAAGVTLALSITAGAYAQCEDSTTTLWYETTAVRLDGNTVRLNGQSRALALDFGARENLHNRRLLELVVPRGRRFILFQRHA